MYEYSIYWIKEEVASHYFHKSDILYRFLKDYEQNNNRLDLRDQYLYITEDFHVDTMVSHLEKYLPKKVTIKYKPSKMEIYTKSQFISLHIEEKHIKFQSGSLQDAEELLFPALRLFQPFLFVVGNTRQNFGWLSPVKFPRDEQRNQVLYSCR